ncbi:hypothetical protein BU17DRAFT_78431 [Hysterangium stoloniferum]|nr:hypothetical protein BU17DRAFT_78431 [Hysterangium stoloniferum]
MVRFKNRWLLVEFIECHSQGPLQELNSKLVWLALKQSVITNFGDVGWGAVSTSLNVKYFSPTTNLCIIRIARDHHKLAWGATTLLTTVNGKDYIPHLIHLAGTIKQAQLAAIRHNKEIIARYRAKAVERGYFREPLGRDSYHEYLQQSQEEIEMVQD